MTAEIVVRNVRPYQPIRPYRNEAARYVTAEEMLPPAVLAETILQNKQDPQWRWKAATRIKENTSHPSDFHPRRTHDPLVVHTIYPFLYEYDMKGRTLSGEDEVRAKYPGLLWAHDVYRNGGTLEHYLQAMLLGGAECDDIGSFIATTSNQVWWYEKTYFDVRQYLADRDWVWIHVLEGSLHGLDLHIENFLWKAISYTQGWKVFRDCFGFAAPLTPEWRTAMLGALNRKILQDTLLAVMRREPRGFNENFIVDQYLKMIELETQQGPRDEKKEQNIKVLMEVISNSFEMAKVDAKVVGVEPRASEELVKVYQERAKSIKATTMEREKDNA